MYFINITLKINHFHDNTVHGLKYLSIDLRPSIIVGALPI